MFALAFFPAVMQDSEAVVSGGSFGVFIQTDTTTGVPNSDALEGVDADWIAFNASGFDATKAVLDVNSQLGFATSTYDINSDFDMEVSSNGYTYRDVDPNYGEITKFLNLSNGTSFWHVWMYVGGEWVSLSSTAGMGHYRPFADFAAGFQSANIALYYGQSVDDIELPVATHNVITVQEMQNNSNFAVTFTLKDASADTVTYDLQNAVGYGSDVYAALKNVSAANNLVSPVGTDSAGQYYSWITSINGKANATSSPWVPYWAFFDNDTGTPSYTSFTMGFYTPLQGGYSSQSVALQASTVLLTYGNGSP